MSTTDTFEDLLRADLATAAEASSTDLAEPVASLLHDGRMQRRRHLAGWAAACALVAVAASTVLGGSDRSTERPGGTASESVVRTVSAYDARVDVVVPGNGPSQADLTERIGVTRQTSGTLLVSASRLGDPAYSSGIGSSGLDPRRGALLVDRDIAVVLAPASAVTASVWSDRDLGVVSQTPASLAEVGLRAFVFRSATPGLDEATFDWAWFRADGTPVGEGGDGHVVRFSDGQRLWVTAGGRQFGLDNLGGPVGGGASAPLDLPLGRISAVGRGEGQALVWTAFALVKDSVGDAAVDYPGRVDDVSPLESVPVPGTGWTALRRAVRGDGGGSPRLTWTGSDGVRHELSAGRTT